MTKEPELTERLRRATVTFHTGTWCRQVAASLALNPGFHPLATLHARTHPGRYHPEGIEALYLANSQDTAARETGSVLPIKSRIIPDGKPPMFIFSVKVEVQKMLVLDDHVLPLLQTSYQELTGHWNYGELAPTQTLGLSAHNLGVEALRVPSAVALGEFNVVVFPTCLLRGSCIEVVDSLESKFWQRIDGTL